MNSTKLGAVCVGVLVAILGMVFTLLVSCPVKAADNSVGIHGGQTNPHSECDDDSCLDIGYATSVSLDRTWEWTDNFSLRYGINAWYMDFSASDRETSSSKRTNTRGQSDFIFTGTLKPSLTVFERYSIFPILGAGVDTSGEVYTVLGGGADVRLYKGLHAEVQSQAMKSNCTWHRVSTIGLRLEF